MDNKIKIFVLVGKSASGKDTLAKALCSENDLNMCVSSTSRPIRVNEVQGVDYNFLTTEEFIAKINDNQLIEYRTYNTVFNSVQDTWYYGTEVSAIKNNAVLVLDVQGLKELKEKLTNVKIISFYLYCDDNVRKFRAKSRGSFCSEEWDRRLKDDELKFKDALHEVDFAINVSYLSIQQILEMLKKLIN